jgi:hypothetical protein
MLKQIFNYSNCYKWKNYFIISNLKKKKFFFSEFIKKK